MRKVLSLTTFDTLPELIRELQSIETFSHSAEYGVVTHLEIRERRTSYTDTGDLALIEETLSDGQRHLVIQFR